MSLNGFKGFLHPDIVELTARTLAPTYFTKPYAGKRGEIPRHKARLKAKSVLEAIDKYYKAEVRSRWMRWQKAHTEEYKAYRREYDKKRNQDPERKKALAASARERYRRKKEARANNPPTRVVVHYPR